MRSRLMEVNLTNVKLGITDIPPIGSPKTNLITFNLYISVPVSIVNPESGPRPSLYHFTEAEMKHYLYQAYHYASEMVNLTHGQDFFDDVIAQPKYMAIFAQYMEFYLNNFALEGLFRAYENSHPGSIPPIGARVNNMIKTSKAKPAVYTSATSGEGC